MSEEKERAYPKNNVFEDVGDVIEAATRDGNIPIVHCIGGDALAGAGIAGKLERKYGLREQLAPIVAEGPPESHVGKALVTRHGEQTIISLVTKPRTRSTRPTYEALQACLISLRHLGIKKLYMPKIGCGMDRLEWFSVKAMLMDTFADTDAEIHIYSY